MLQPLRPLPKRLKPDETWESWLDVADVPKSCRDKAFTLARARLSNGSVVKSRRGDPPPVGQVPGGSTQQPSD